MTEEKGKGGALKTVLIVVGALLAVCCVGGGVMAWVGKQRIEEAGGLENAMRKVVAEAAGERDAAARAFLTTLLVDGDVPGAYEQTSEGYRSVVDAEQLAGVASAVGAALGAYDDAAIRNYNVQSTTATGTVHRLAYDANFERGQAVVHVDLVDVDGALLVDRFDVESDLLTVPLPGSEER